MLLRLANVYDIDIRDFTARANDGGSGELSEILSDALVRDIGIARDEVLEVSENYPGVSEAIARFYRALSDLRRLPGEAAAGSAAQPRWSRRSTGCARRSRGPAIILPRSMRAPKPSPRS